VVYSRFGSKHADYGSLQCAASPCQYQEVSFMDIAIKGAL
jgi:hypothetical protein